MSALAKMITPCSTSSEQLHPGMWQIWTSAIRPKTLTASVAPVALGTALAVADGFHRPLAALAALFGALFIQVGTNLFNDYADFQQGADTEDRIGPARATQKGWLKGRTVLQAATLSFLLAMLAGGYLVSVAGWPLAVVGLVSIAAGIAYTAGPRSLAYIGLGDLFVFLFFGLAAVNGTYFVQTNSFSFQALWLSCAVGGLNTAIIVVNNLRDRSTDQRANKNTLAVRFGARFSRIEYTALLCLAYVVPLILAANNQLSRLWVVYLSLPWALSHMGTLWRYDGAKLNPLLGKTAQLGLIYTTLLCGGILW